MSWKPGGALVLHPDEVARLASLPTLGFLGCTVILDPHMPEGKLLLLGLDQQGSATVDGVFSLPNAPEGGGAS